ncbi:hypothetical protein Rsub_03252 [Raphidocelis subcapitata]|uniref:Uncharacterized protein n=1 Tax=Raphidocelis subcapitata TaxID=307507 RepID=A0A2V0NS15_9CHLO|nr:hypothetical protein Rsub_03252 [Raphidocelis subcapitata]|eukprot:GBF90119.1 hypothetical protein Rsub_03252 [Raphidocelis subcapitata]
MAPREPSEGGLGRVSRLLDAAGSSISALRAEIAHIRVVPTKSKLQLAAPADASPVVPALSALAAGSLPHVATAGRPDVAPPSSGGAPLRFADMQAPPKEEDGSAGDEDGGWCGSPETPLIRAYRAAEGLGSPQGQPPTPNWQSVYEEIISHTPRVAAAALAAVARPAGSSSADAAAARSPFAEVAVPPAAAAAAPPSASAAAAAAVTAAAAAAVVVAAAAAQQSGGGRDLLRSAGDLPLREVLSELAELLSRGCSNPSTSGSAGGIDAGSAPGGLSAGSGWGLRNGPFTRLREPISSRGGARGGGLEAAAAKGPAKERRAGAHAEVLTQLRLVNAAAAFYRISVGSGSGGLPRQRVQAQAAKRRRRQQQQQQQQQALHALPAPFPNAQAGLLVAHAASPHPCSPWQRAVQGHLPALPPPQASSPHHRQAEPQPRPRAQSPTPRPAFGSALPRLPARDAAPRDVSAARPEALAVAEVHHERRMRALQARADRLAEVARAAAAARQRSLAYGRGGPHQPALARAASPPKARGRTGATSAVRSGAARSLSPPQRMVAAQPLPPFGKRGLPHGLGMQQASPPLPPAVSKTTFSISSMKPGEPPASPTRRPAMSTRLDLGALLAAAGPARAAAAPAPPRRGASSRASTAAARLSAGSLRLLTGGSRRLSTSSMRLLSGGSARSGASPTAARLPASPLRLMSRSSLLGAPPNPASPTATRLSVSSLLLSGGALASQAAVAAPARLDAGGLSSLHAAPHAVELAAAGWSSDAASCGASNASGGGTPGSFDALALQLPLPPPASWQQRPQWDVLPWQERAQPFEGQRCELPTRCAEARCDELYSCEDGLQGAPPQEQPHQQEHQQGTASPLAAGAAVAAAPFPPQPQPWRAVGPQHHAPLVPSRPAPPPPPPRKPAVERSVSTVATMVQAFEEASAAGEPLQVNDDSANDGCSTPRMASALDSRGDDDSGRRSRLATVVGAFRRRLASIRVRPEAGRAALTTAEAAAQSGFESPCAAKLPLRAPRAARPNAQQRSIEAVLADMRAELGGFNGTDARGSRAGSGGGEAKSLAPVQHQLLSKLQAEQRRAELERAAAGAAPRQQTTSSSGGGATGARREQRELRPPAARAGGAVRAAAHRRARSFAADLAALADTVKRASTKRAAAAVRTAPVAACTPRTAPGVALADTATGAEVLRLTAGRCSTVGDAASGLCVGALVSLGAPPPPPQDAPESGQQPQLAFVLGADGGLHVCTSAAPLACEATRVVRVALASFSWSPRSEAVEVVTAADARHGVAVSSERSWARLVAGLNAALLLGDAGPGAPAAALEALPIERMAWSPRVEGLLV